MCYRRSGGRSGVQHQRHVLHVFDVRRADHVGVRAVGDARVAERVRQRLHVGARLTRARVLVVVHFVLKTLSIWVYIH